MRGMKGICERKWCDLDEATLDLANVNGRVDRAADVHADVCAQSLEVASQSVQLHLRAGSAVGEVVEGHVITKSCSQPCTRLPTKRRRQQRSFFARKGGGGGGGGDRGAGGAGTVAASWLTV